MKELSLTEKKKAMSMDKIVHDSLHYFEENGYYNTSIEMLCEKAMISRTTFFNYFGNKGEADQTDHGRWSEGSV